jgi:hypothetical protein
MEFASSDQSAAIFDGAKPSLKFGRHQYAVWPSKNTRQNGRFCQEINGLVSKISGIWMMTGQAGACSAATNWQGRLGSITNVAILVES